MTCFLTISADGSTWWEVPPPSDYSVIDQPIYSGQSQRDTSGSMHLDLIAVKAQVSLQWNAMSPTAFVHLCSITGTGGTVKCRFFDPQRGSVRGTAASPVEMYRDTSFSYAPIGGWTDSSGDYHPQGALPDSGDGSISLAPVGYTVSMTLTEM